MNIITERKKVIEELKLVKDIELLRAVRFMLRYGQKHEGRISIDDYNREIEEAEAEIDKGEYYTQAEVEKLSEKW